MINLQQIETKVETPILGSWKLV